MSETAFRIDDVTFWYGSSDKPALRDVSLSARVGECVLVTGPSGCGKTTLTHLVNGLVPHIYDGRIKGTVRVLGQDLSETGRGWIGTRVGSVFQNPRGQFVNRDVLSEVAFGCENQGVLRERLLGRVAGAVEALGIGELLDRKVSELSGGQRQMVILASAYAMDSDVFVFDEPAASLDVPSMVALAKVIGRLKERGKTVLVSEHRLWWLADLADRVVLMDEGTVAGEWGASEFGRLGREERERAGMREWRAGEIGLRPPEPSGAPRPPGALEADSLDFAYARGRKVLSGLGARFPAGTVTGIVGGNGAGKTSLLRCMAGLARESRGSVSLEGCKLPVGKRPRSVQLVMQEPGYQLFGSTVEGELASALACAAPDAAAARGDAAAAVAGALEEFGLFGLESRHPLSLSGGQRQRLAIAAGLLRGASVLLLDEPTSGLDLRSMKAVARALRAAARNGAAVALVTHDYEFLCAAADEIAELREGRIADTYPLCRDTEARARKQLGFDE